MAYFAKTSTGYFNVDAIAFIAQQVGGAYRIRFTDGMVQVVTQDDGDAVMRAIDATFIPESEDDDKPRRKPKGTSTTKKTA